MEKIRKIFEGINLKAILSSVVLSVIIFLVLFLGLRVNKSTVSVLVTANSETAAIQLEKIAVNISKLPMTLNFYDRLLASNDDVRDLVAGKSNDERKAFWNDMVTVESVEKNSSIIEISIRSANENDSQQLAKKAAGTLLDTVGLYYNVKSDVELHIIDGPVTKKVSANSEWFLMLSLILGSVIGWLISMINFSSVSNFISEKREGLKTRMAARLLTDEAVAKKIESTDSADQEKEAAAQWESDDLSSKQEPVAKEESQDKTMEEKELETLNKIIQQDIYPNFPEMPKHAQPKASAPDNLPIADSSFFTQQNGVKPEQEEEKKPEQHEEKPQKTTSEPTPEELKKRLNELLKGKL